MGHFYYAAKAFDVLERLDPNPEYWEGKRGACVGVFQLIIAGHEQRFVSRKFLSPHSLELLPLCLSLCFNICLKPVTLTFSSQFTEI